MQAYVKGDLVRTARHGQALVCSALNGDGTYILAWIGTDGLLEWGIVTQADIVERWELRPALQILRDVALGLVIPGVEGKP